MTTAYQVFIDDDDDGVVDEDYTQYVHHIECSLGFDNDLQHVAPLSWAKITMDDLSSLAAGTVYNHQVVIKAVSGATTRTIWTGWGRSIGNINSERQTMVLDCVGLEEPLYTQRVSIPIQQDQSAGTILQLVIDQVNFRIKDLATALILNDAVLGFLGKTLESGHDIATALDTGIQTFPYAGDRWDNAIAINIIKDIVSSDGGRFFADRTGILTFQDRNTLILGSGVAITDTALTDETLVTGAEVFNASQVTFAGRFVGAPDSVLFSIDAALKIRSGIPRTIKCRFRDSNANPSGATQIDDINQVTNYTATEFEDGSGRDGTTFLSVAVIATDGNSVTLDLYQTTGIDIWLQTLSITGTPLSRSDPVTVEIVDMVKATKDGYRYLASSAPLLSTSELAEDFANFELARRKLSNAIYKSVIAEVDNDDGFLAGSVLDSITILGDTLYVEANAASDPARKEANTTTGWANASSTLTSDSTIKSNGGYSIKSVFTATTGFISYDLNTILTVGETYYLVFNARHLGNGGLISINLAAGSAGIDTEIAFIDNTIITFTEYTLTFVHSATTRYLSARERSITNDGGVYIDNIAIYKPTTAGIFKETHNAANNGLKQNELILGYSWNVFDTLPFTLDNSESLLS